MAAASLPYIERAEIHKSCRALEGIVNIFSDYCQAAEALAVTQRRLARTLKDAAALKATNRLAGSALNAAATFFEALAEIDACFVKVANKECETVTNELEKWMRKLAKEERNHNDKLSSSNVKIKETGQALERMAKRKDSDAAVENNRYVNPLGVIGPEMSQEDQNNGQLISQKHTLAVYAVASGISHMADAEWHRTRESVRQSASIIGRIGEYCAYIEGEWTGKIPDAVDADNKDYVKSSAQVCEQEPVNRAIVDEMGIRVRNSAQQAPNRTGPPAQYSMVQTDEPALNTLPLLISSASLATPASSTVRFQPQDANQLQSKPLATTSAPQSTYLKVSQTLAPGESPQFNSDSVRSIESLSSFPTPPMYFPLPRMALLPRPTIVVDNVTRVHSGVSPSTEIASKSSNNFTGSSVTLPGDESEESSSGQVRDPDLVGPVSVVGQQLEVSGAASASEVGICIRNEQDGRVESTSSSNSIVASMRDKWDRGDLLLPTQSRERDTPRLTSKVSDLVNRYDPLSTSSQSSASSRPSDSPAEERPRKVSFLTQNGSKDEAIGYSRGQAVQAETPAASKMPPPPPRIATKSEAARRRSGWHPEDVEGLDIAEGWQVLSTHELKLEFQRERKQLHALGSPGSASSSASGSRPRWSHSQHSYSMTDLVMPRANMNIDVAFKRPAVGSAQRESASSRKQHLSQYSIPPILSSSTTSLPSQQGISTSLDHAPYCGCHTCSVVHYSSPAHARAGPSTSSRTQMQTGKPTQMQTRMQSVQSQSRAQAQTQILGANKHVQKDKDKDKDSKPRSWIRRLSVPVVSHAFLSSSSSSSAGSGSTYAYGAGAGISSASLQSQSQLPLSLHLEGLRQDSTGGIGFVRPRKSSFGRK